MPRRARQAVDGLFGCQLNNRKARLSVGHKPGFSEKPGLLFPGPPIGFGSSPKATWRSTEHDVELQRAKPCAVAAARVRPPCLLPCAAKGDAAGGASLQPCCIQAARPLRSGRALHLRDALPHRWWQEKSSEAGLLPQGFRIRSAYSLLYGKIPHNH